MLQKLAGGELAQILLLQERRHLISEALAAKNAAPSELRQAAMLAMLANDRDTAAALLDRAAVNIDDRGDAWFCKGLLAIADSSWDSALVCFRTAAHRRFTNSSELESIIQQIDSHDIESNRYFIFQLFYDTFPDDFCMFVSFEAVKDLERQGYTFCFARSILYLGSHPGCQYFLDLDFSLNGASVWHCIASGKIAWLYGNKDQADAAFRQGRDLAMTWGVVPYHFDCGIMAWLTRTEALALLQPAKTLGAVLSITDFKFSSAESERSFDIAFVVGCDTGYFRFLPNFIFSVLYARIISRSQARVIIHCHVADPSDIQISYLKEINDFFIQNSLNVCIRTSFNKSQFQEAAYYTCLRFLVLPEVLEKYRCAAVAVDVDSTITPEFFHKLDSILENDFGFRAFTFPPNSRRPVAGEPWAIGAHPTFVNFREIGLEFAYFLQKYVQHAYNPKWFTNWCIDQCAIGRGYDLLIAENPEIRLMNFAYVANLYELPDGAGKDAFLEGHGGISTDNFLEKVRSLITS